jgi:hypothetical protein
MSGCRGGIERNGWYGIRSMLRKESELNRVVWHSVQIASKWRMLIMINLYVRFCIHPTFRSDKESSAWPTKSSTSLATGNVPARGTAKATRQWPLKLKVIFLAGNGRGVRSTEKTTRARDEYRRYRANGELLVFFSFISSLKNRISRIE